MRFSEINDISTWVKDVESIETKEDGHLNLAEIALLQRYLNRAGISWSNAWEQCMIDLDDNLYTSRKLHPIQIAKIMVLICVFFSNCKKNDSFGA